MLSKSIYNDEELENELIDNTVAAPDIVFTKM